MSRPGQTITLRAGPGSSFCIALAAVLLACKADMRETSPGPQMSPSVVAAANRCEGADMEIRFERSGGFAGMTLSTELHTDSLSASESKEICDLVEDAAFFDLPSSTGPGTGADRFSYRITITDGGRSHTVRTDDDTAPPSLVPLLDRLSRAARRR